jgi:hypothetical protein
MHSAILLLIQTKQLYDQVKTLLYIRFGYNTFNARQIYLLSKSKLHTL